MIYNKNVIYFLLLIKCFQAIMTQYLFTEHKLSTRYSYSFYKGRKVVNNTSMIETHTEYMKCVASCLNKKENCKSIDAEIIKENTTICRFFNEEFPTTIFANGFTYISSIPPKCSTACNSTQNLCGKCICNPSCAARNRRQYICNCTSVAGIAKSCQEHLNNGFTTTGIYQISPNGSSFKVMCEMVKADRFNQKVLLLKVDDVLLQKNILITTLQVLEKTYSIFFNFKPISYPADREKNVIYLTNNGLENDRYRIYINVWFSMSGCLLIYLTFSENKNYEITTEQIPLNAWSSILLSQTKINDIYSYTVYLNGTNIFSTVNSMRQSFNNVKIFNANPIVEFPNGLIKDLRIIGGNGNFEDLDEHVLKKNALISVMPRLEKIYSIFFKFTQRSFSNSWKSIFYFTDNNILNNRRPGVWSSEKADGKLLITSPIVNDNNFFTDAIPLNVWASIRMLQYQIQGTYVFKTYLNDQVIHSVTNTQAQLYSNVSFFISNDWDFATDGAVKDLRIINANEYVDETEENKLSRGNLIAILKLLKKTFTVSFHLKPRSYSPGWKSVIYLALGNDSFESRDRALVVCFCNDGSGRLFISSVVNGNNTYSFLTDPLVINKWSFIQISQTLENGTYIFRINLNEKAVHSVENKIPQSFHNVEVFTSDPWYDAQNALIKNLKINSANKGVWIPMMTRFFSWESSFWNRSFEDYETGFGLVNQQWIGLKNLNEITNTYFTDMRVDYFLSPNNVISTMYYNIWVGSSSSNYMFRYDEYNSMDSLEPDLFNGNGATFKKCSNWWTTRCDEMSPTSNDSIFYGTTVNLFSIQFFLRTNEMRLT